MKKAVLFIIAICFFFSAAQALMEMGEGTGKTEVELKEIEPFVYVSLRHKGPLSDIEDVINDLILTIQSLGVNPQGPMIGIFHTILGPDDPEDLEMEWEIGFPIGEQSYIRAREEIKPKLERKVWEHPLVASAKYSGPYQEMGEAITDIFQWMEREGYDKAGPVLTTFLEAGTPDAPPSELKGEIWIPCKK
ncbi:MAG: GyrI-like domain-containing protein [Candidatus Aminicenantes bacterium]|nr:MAG: GyrI-like domain-containing protein [Candidatus Aminicenantes bacterium]